MRLNGNPIAKPILTNLLIFFAGQIREGSVEKPFQLKLGVIVEWDHPRRDVGYIPTKFLTCKIKFEKLILKACIER